MRKVSNPYVTIPKAELHVHLDGSLRPQTMLELAYEQNKPLVHDSVQALQENLCFQSGFDLPRCLQSFQTTLSVLQNAGGLERVAYELCEDLHRDGVTYAEIRYCPSLHTQKDLTRYTAICAVWTGMERARQEFGIETRQILTCLRDFGEEDAGKVVQAANLCRSLFGVVGVDLAGNEYKHPPGEFIAVLEEARARGLAVTVHAGEGKTEQALNDLRTVVERMDVQRIGHAVALRLDPNLMGLVREKNIALEICSTSDIILEV